MNFLYVQVNLTFWDIFMPSWQSLESFQLQALAISVIFLIVGYFWGKTKADEILIVVYLSDIWYLGLFILAIWIASAAFRILPIWIFQPELITPTNFWASFFFWEGITEVLLKALMLGYLVGFLRVYWRNSIEI
jgi:hypothetical protein